MKLSELIKQNHFASPGHEAILNIVVTSSWLMNELATAMAPFGVTPAQYNVLRILRGSHPDRRTCSDIGERLLDRTPDVTRLLNRMQHAGLICRRRAEHDRRVVEVGITADGMGLLDRMQPTVEAVTERLVQHLSEDALITLNQALEQIRADQ